MGGFLQPGLGKAPARRGLTELRLITNWVEIAGIEAAEICTPQRISHAGRQMGGTLIVQAQPGRGPEVDMLAPQVLERVNACFGYRAVTRLKVSQGLGRGFAEPGAAFDRSDAPGQVPPDPERRKAISKLVAGIPDAGLRETLEQLGLAIAARPGKGVKQ